MRSGSTSSSSTTAIRPTLLEPDTNGDAANHPAAFGSERPFRLGGRNWSRCPIAVTARPDLGPSNRSCGKRTIAVRQLLDNLVGAGQDGYRDGKTQGICGLEIYRQLDF